MDTRSIVEGAGACFNNREFDGLDRLVSADMVNHAAGPQGLEGWKQIWRSIISCFPDAHAETHLILVEGDQAAVHMTIEGTHEGSDMPLLAGIEPTHTRVHWEFIHLFRVQHERIVEHRAVRDDLGLLRQLQAQ